MSKTNEGRRANPTANEDTVIVDLNPLREAALDYAGAGWRVFPCHPMTKAPLTVHGFKDGTTDQDRIRSWWRRWPDALIGAPVPDGVTVLDVDPRHGGTVEALGQLPDTLRCWSGRGDGGVHVYFQRPFGQLTDRRLEGIDLRDAQKHYVIVPPSPHPATGKPYRWEGEHIAPMPTELIELLRAPDRPVAGFLVGMGGGDGSALVHTVTKAAEGERNKILFWASCRAVESGNLDAIGADLRDAALSVGLAEAEVLRTMDSAVRTVGGAA